MEVLAPATLVCPANAGLYDGVLGSLVSTGGSAESDFAVFSCCCSGEFDPPHEANTIAMPVASNVIFLLMIILLI